MVDTPPSRSALDFLDAPARLGRFLDGRMLRLLLAPARAGGRSMFSLVTASFGMFSRVVQKVLGAQLLTDLSGFVAALDSMFGGFRQRAEQTYRILQDRETAFLVVAAPEPDAVREAAYFAAPAGRRADAAGRAGAQPGAPHAVPTLTAEREPGGRRGRLDEAGRPGGHRRRAAGARGPGRAGGAGDSGWPDASPTQFPHVPTVPSRRSPPTSTTSTGCERSARRSACRDQHLAPCRASRPRTSCASSPPAGAGAAARAARVRSCRPRHRTRCGCRVRRPGTRTAPGSCGRSASRRSARRPARTARPGRRSGTPPCVGQSVIMPICPRPPLQSRYRLCHTGRLSRPRAGRCSPGHPPPPSPRKRWMRAILAGPSCSVVV